MTAFAVPLSTQKLDLPPAVRIAAGAASELLPALCVYEFVRWMMGCVPATPWVRDVALTTHEATVIPAIPLGA